MKDAMEEYRAGLADFSQHGRRWAALGASPGNPSFVFWGRAAGLGVEEIVAAAHALGVRDRDGDLRRAWNTAHPNGGDRPQDWRPPRAQPKPPPTFPRFVRDCIGDLADRDKSEWPDCRDLFLDLKSLSPWEELTAWDADTDISGWCCHKFLESLYDPGDVLFVFDRNAHPNGVPGRNLMPCRDWLARLERGDGMPGDLVVSNPFSGAEGTTTGGTKSFVAQNCLSRYPFVIVEFDAMPLELQCAFWRGLLTKSPLAPKVASLVYSGNKSVHGLLRVGAATLADWQTARDKLRRLICADPDPAFRADEQAMRPRTGTRLPGVRRFSNGKMQELLYLNPGAVPPPQEPPADAPESMVC